MTPLIHKRSTPRRLGADLDAVAALSRNELLGVAVARGCHHYAPFVAPEFVADRPELSHEVLGCALLRGPADLDTFQCIRVAAMVLSDEACSSTTVAAAAAELGVESRLAHIARVALAAGDRPGYWRKVLEALPSPIEANEAEFLPGVSRFRLETGKSGPGMGAAWIWLRTHYAQ